jgi:hypothetical protein
MRPTIGLSLVLPISYRALAAYNLTWAWYSLSESAIFRWRLTWCSLHLRSRPVLVCRLGLHRKPYMISTGQNLEVVLHLLEMRVMTSVFCRSWTQVEEMWLL